MNNEEIECVEAFGSLPDEPWYEVWVRLTSDEEESGWERHDFVKTFVYKKSAEKFCRKKQDEYNNTDVHIYACRFKYYIKVV